MVLVLCFTVVEQGWAQKRFSVNDLGKLTSISDPQISPDGKSIAVIVSKPDYDINRFKTDLVVVDISSGTHRALTQDRLYVSQPRWSPSGDALAFLCKVITPKEHAMQLFILPMMGGEAKQITWTAKGVQHYAWNPTGESIAFVTADDGVAKEKLEKGYDAFEVGDNDMFVTSPRTSAHIWLVPAKGGESKRLTSGSWSLPITIPPGPPSSALSWSADGTTIAFVKVPSAQSGDFFKRTVHLLNVSTGVIKPLTTHMRAESHPSFGHAKDVLVYHYVRDGQLGNVSDIWVTSPLQSEGTNLTLSLDRDIHRVLWFHDHKSLLIGGHDGDSRALWVQSIFGTRKKLNLGSVTPNGYYWIDMSVGKNGAVAFVGSTPQEPSELYYMGSVSELPKKLTSFNSALNNYNFGKTEIVRWSNEGFDHSGVLTYPVEFSEGKQYPLVLIIHGGPGSAAIPSFSALSQILSNKGYFVFQPNFRGSDNLGSKYKIANIKDFGPGPGRDIVAGLQKLKASGMIDSTKVGICGWSYGGYMSTWLATQYDLWKVVVVGAPISDLMDQYCLSDGNVGSEERFGSPFKGSSVFAEQSPIHFVKNIKAPVLILANTLDPRVPITHSYKLFHALRDNNITTRFIAWPIAAHMAGDPVRQKETYRHWTEWIDQYIHSAKPGSLVNTTR